MRRFLIIVGMSFGVIIVLLVIIASVTPSPDRSDTSSPEQDSKEAAKKSGSKKESETGEPVPAVIRVSGEPGTPYRCS